MPIFTVFSIFCFLFFTAKLILQKLNLNTILEEEFLRLNEFQAKVVCIKKEGFLEGDITGNTSPADEQTNDSLFGFAKTTKPTNIQSANMGISEKLSEVLQGIRKAKDRNICQVAQQTQAPRMKGKRKGATKKKGKDAATPYKADTSAGSTGDVIDLDESAEGQPTEDVFAQKGRKRKRNQDAGTTPNKADTSSDNADVDTALDERRQYEETTAKNDTKRKTGCRDKNKGSREDELEKVPKNETANHQKDTKGVKSKKKLNIDHIVSNVASDIDFESPQMNLDGTENINITAKIQSLKDRFSFEPRKKKTNTDSMNDVLDNNDSGNCLLLAKPKSFSVSASTISKLQDFKCVSGLGMNKTKPTTKFADLVSYGKSLSNSQGSAKSITSETFTNTNNSSQIFSLDGDEDFDYEL